MNNTVKCPHCGKANADNWPLNVSGIIRDGGCQDCWETESDRTWWEAVIALDNWSLYAQEK